MAVVSTHFSHRAGSTTAPSAYHLCDTVSDLPTGTEGDIAYTKDVDQFYKKTTAGWIALCDSPLVGSWTPSIGGSGGQTGQVHTSQIGTYVKIPINNGARFKVFVQATLGWSTRGTITGNVVINGLPFTSLNSAARGTVNFPFFTGFAVNVAWMGGYVINNSTQIGLTYMPAAGATGISTPVQATLSNAQDLVFSGDYETS